MDAIGARPALEQFFDHLNDGVLLFDRRAQVTFANTAALRRMPGILARPSENGRACWAPRWWIGCGTPLPRHPAPCARPATR